MDPEAKAVLDFWFEELTVEQHFRKDDAVDSAIRRRFGALVERLGQAAPQAWLDDPRAVLAAVIVLDQFPRNIHRGDPRAFAHDAEALALTKLALERGHDRGLSQKERQFLYMPLMHSEALEDQRRCVALFETLGDADALDFARRHLAIIERFGRFPHRNAALGRASSAEEAAFLQEPGSGF